MLEVDDTVYTLTIETTIVEDGGTYTVRAINEFGECSSSADVLIIFESPSFPQPLSDITLTVGQPVTLECTVSGTPEPTTTWFISGIEAWESEKYHTERHDQTTTLTIQDVTLDDAEMEFVCKAINPIGEATTSARLFPQGEFDIWLSISEA